jgi:exodeoxyribonuclease-3
MKSVRYGIGIDLHDHEGRVITCEFEDFYLVCCYTPNSQNELKRLGYRMQWEDDFRAYLVVLDEVKPVILTGDLNVAHEEIDLKNPKTNHENPGFSDEERESFGKLLDAGFTDTFRARFPDLEGAYSWWSYRGRARERNTGWRIDYFLVSDRIADQVSGAYIYNEVFGSDHCPVGLDIRL